MSTCRLPPDGLSDALDAGSRVCWTALRALLIRSANRRSDDVFSGPEVIFVKYSMSSIDS